MKLIFGKYKKDDLWKLFIQFVKFGIVGVSNTAISLVVYYICIFIGMHYMIANILSFVISVLNAYYWNKRFVFKKNDIKQKKTVVQSVLKVFTSYGATFLLGTVLLVIWIDVIHISEVIAPLINLCITIPLNFILNKFWAFR